MDFDAVVAGAGIWGCTVARRLAEAGRRVLVLEKRAAVGGNCRCETDPETGVEVHVYGSHIFHTKSERVWDFIRRFTDFNAYRHFVLANWRGKIYHLPFGCTLLKEFFGRDLKPSELNADDRKAIFDAFVRGYTSKQWGVPPEKVDPAIIARLKIRDSDSIDYFDDPHQGIPLDGYNALFERLLDHPNVTVRCNTAYQLPSANCQLPTSVYYSGPLDALFGYRFGPLPWRSLRFETETVPVADYQHAAVVNYTEAEVPYTRIHEFRHYHPEVKSKGEAEGRSVIMREYPRAWQPGDEPYYPIAGEASAALLEKYRAEAARVPNLILGGRLGQYKYYDMDQAMLSALDVTEGL